MRLPGWLGQDVGDGVRQLSRHPAYAALVVATLAVGLATGTAVFTYVNAFRQPFPGADSGDLHQIFLASEDDPFGPISYPDYLDLTEAGGGLFDVAALGQPLFAASVRTDAYTGVVFGNAVSGSFFPLMRVRMALGRGLTPADDEPDAPPAVVISHAYWSEEYGSDPDVPGRTVFLNGRPYTIVGVAAPDFRGSLSASRPEVWLPLTQFRRVYWARSDREVNREVGSISPYVKLREGVTASRAREALAVVARRLDAEAPLVDRTRRLILEPATWIHPAVRRAELPTTRIMLVAAACLLLLACANAANLVLSAGTRRDHEIALRSAMGASRRRLIRQLLSESLLLSLSAGALALLIASPAAHRLSSYFARPSVWGADVPREVSPDLAVLGVGVLLAVLSGLLTGIVPALRVSGRDPAPALRGGRGTGEQRAESGRRLGTRDLLVAAQVGLSVVLLFVASLVLRTLDSARNVDPGFDTEWTLASYVSTSSMDVPVEGRHAFYRELIRRFEELPWVRAAAVSEQAPLSWHPGADLQLPERDEPVQVTVARVFPGYFEALDIPILRGRPLVPGDTVPTPAVVVVNQALAERVAGPGNPVGRQVTLPADGNEEARIYEIVGVARSARTTTLLDDPELVAYFSLPQHYSAPGNAFLLRVDGSPASAVRSMEQELRAVDPRIAIVNVLPYSDVVDGFLYTQRMNAELFTLIALLGLVLSAAGIFGVTSLAVARMRREVGIRLAIGANPRSIARLVVSRVAVAVLVGFAAGLGGAFVVARWVEGLLFQVRPLDPLSFGTAALGLMGAAAVALYLPIRRALAVDPVSSLRAE